MILWNFNTWIATRILYFSDWRRIEKSLSLLVRRLYQKCKTNPWPRESFKWLYLGIGKKWERGLEEEGGDEEEEEERGELPESTLIRCQFSRFACSAVSIERRDRILSNFWPILPLSIYLCFAEVGSTFSGHQS